MSLGETSLLDDIDDGTETIEEAQYERRVRRRRSGPTRREARGADRALDDRADSTRRRRAYGGLDLRGLGGILVLIAVLVIAAVYFGAGRGELGDPFRDRSDYHQDRYAYPGQLDRFSDADQRDHFVARGGEFGDTTFVRPVEARGAWAEERREASPWAYNAPGFRTGGILLVVGLLLLAIMWSRSAFAGRDDD